MNILRMFRRPELDESLPTVVIFSGGMGTQIIQAAVYFYIKNTGHPVYADLTYFDVDARIAQPGNLGQLTHWFWQLDPFGLPRSAFNQIKASLDRDNVNILRDGQKMMELGLNALAMPEIQARFKDDAGIGDAISKDVEKDFLCVHIRRGDYVNVASHLISDLEFIDLIRRFSGLTTHVVFLSDSPIEENFRHKVSQYFNCPLFLDKIDPYLAHRVMRRARILVCSNSTYSLTAAMLNPRALVIVPKKWFSEKDREIEAPIQARCIFQIMV